MVVELGCGYTEWQFINDLLEADMLHVLCSSRKWLCQHRRGAL